MTTPRMRAPHWSGIVVSLLVWLLIALLLAGL